MSLVAVMLISAAALAAGYFLYGGLLARLFRLDASAKTPAVEMRDDVDYIPTSPKYLIGQHFSAIAAAGPIVGPILAALMFGWLPTLLWILFGAIFIGGVHDFGALVASVRHKARSIAEVVREHMTRRSYLLFLAFVWLALVYIIVAFTDIVATSFVGTQKLENGLKVSGGGIAASSMMYLCLPILMALLMRWAKVKLWLATLIFLPLVGVAIWAGQYVPLDVAAIFGTTDEQAIRVWDVTLLAYCFAASIVPMWLLLQPRGHLGGFFLFVALLGGVLGVLFGGQTVRFPAFTDWTTKSGDTLFPMLFITVACGACSGFHALVASGTTSKQLERETHAKPVAYGAMLLEGLVAVVALSCVMMLGAADKAASQGPNLIFGMGMSKFLEVVGIPAAFGISFGLLAFATFVYDTLDVSTRLGRYVFQELTNWQTAAGRWCATAVTVLVPLAFVMQKTCDASGKPIPAWKVFWGLFGASNQLLAALALIAITVWLVKTRKARWVWFVTGLPAAWMYAMSTWALARLILGGFFTPKGEFKGCIPDAATMVGVVVLALAVLLLVETLRVLARMRSPAAPAA